MDELEGGEVDGDKEQGADAEQRRDKIEVTCRWVEKKKMTESLSRSFFPALDSHGVIFGSQVKPALLAMGKSFPPPAIRRLSFLIVYLCILLETIWAAASPRVLTYLSPV